VLTEAECDARRSDRCASSKNVSSFLSNCPNQKARSLGVSSHARRHFAEKEKVWIELLVTNQEITVGLSRRNQRNVPPEESADQQEYNKDQGVTEEN
jgi:hypothetical protein